MALYLERQLAEPTIYPESWLNQYDAGPVHPYWVERVGEAVARTFRLGFDPEAEAVTYPLRDPDGGVRGIVRRSLGGTGPKYMYPSGVDVGHLLFHYTPEHREAVVLAEGALDAIALWSVGIDAFAIYGSRLSEHQVKLIDKIDPTYVITCYDLDAAGWQAHVETERACRDRLIDRIVWPKGWGSDVAELSLEHRRKVVHDLVSSGLACIQ